MSEVELIQYIEANIRELIPSLDVINIDPHVRVEDKVVDLRLQTKNNDIYLIEAKMSSEPAKVYEAISQLKSYASNNKYLIVATPKMSEKGKFLCQQADVGYFDLQGNVYLKYKDILIDRTGEREIPPEFRRKKRRVKQPFSEASFRVLLYLLINRERYVTQQELFEKLKISKGYVNRILKTFEDGIKLYGETILFQDDLTDTVSINIPNFSVIGETTTRKSSPELLSPSPSKKPIKYYRITNPGKVLEILSKKYEFNDNKILGLYSFERNPTSLIQKIAQVSKQTNLPYALTQHAGASQVAPYVRFNDVYLYVKEQNIQNWKSVLNLKETELGGNVNLVIPRYKWYLNETQTVNGITVVNDVLLYLDLINYPKRGEEQAEFLRDQRLRF
ncbi:MAG: MarR family transcriptional regulator [Candidatus Hodarchaeota archaeon]